MKYICLLLLTVFFAQPAAAIEIFNSKRPDPFKEGAECNYPELVSYGGYVYSYPSKYDLVFEPFISLIATCPESGYVSFNEHFETFSDNEKILIAEYLEDHPWTPEHDSPQGFNTMLDQMEQIYNLRDRSIEDQAHFLRTRAWYWAEDSKADEYRKRALDLHKKIIASKEVTGFELISNLYLIGFYSWRLGEETSAENFFRQALEVEWIDEDGAKQVGSDYIKELIEEIKAGKADDEVRFSFE